ncbi:MAG TPA: copper transporter [Acidimicrobiales bacterium]|jgi:hypothetical protein|nr:copper transporter [Acidimicrobiales bacterium]
MINFRFHIVSLTAVLLALGIGLVLGTTFLDEATIDGLKSQLDGLERDLDAAEERNRQQQARLDMFESERDQLAELLGERLYDGLLEGEPVLVVSTQGVEERWVDEVLRMLTQADAQVLGVWWLTDRLVLDDDGEVEDLAAALELSTDDADRLRRNLAVQLADVLYGATEAPEATAPPEDAAGQTAPAEPPALARLRDAGFVEYELPEGAEGDVVRLPVSNLRVVVVDGPGASVSVGEVLLPVLEELTSDGPVPVVATQPSVRTDDDVDATEEPQLVQAIRGDEELAERITTVDNLDHTAGRVATLLATVDAAPGSPTVARYGTGEGVDGLLPSPADEG